MILLTGYCIETANFPPFYFDYTKKQKNIK